MKILRRKLCVKDRRVKRLSRVDVKTGGLCNARDEPVKRFSGVSVKTVVLIELRFYGPVNPLGSCRAGQFT